MIPQAYLTAWSAKAPWPVLRQVEQDLMISRALCDLFNAPALRGKVAFRGGTAINNLLFPQPLRYSEDIDLVQMQQSRSARPLMRSVTHWHGWASATASRPGIRCALCSSSHPRRTRNRR